MIRLMGVMMPAYDAINRIREGLSILRGNLLVLVVSWIFLYFASSMTYPYEQLYFQALGASALTIGLISSLRSTLLCVFRIPGAYIADHYGRKGIIVVLSYGMALSSMIFAFAPDWRVASIGVVAYSICMMYQPALQAILADSIPPGQRGVGYALADVVPATAGALAPLVAGTLVRRYGFLSAMRITYLLVAFLSLIAATIRALWLKETLKTRKKLKLKNLLSELGRALVDMMKALRGLQEQLVRPVIFLSFVTFEEALIMPFLPLYAIDIIGISKPDWALLGTISSIVTLAAGLPLGRLVDTLGRRRALLLTHLFWVPSTLYFVCSRSLWEVVLVFVAFTLGVALFRPAYQALLADLTPREARGRVMGFVGVLSSIIAIPASALGGFLYEINPITPFIVCVVLEIASTVLVLSIREPIERRA